MSQCEQLLSVQGIAKSIFQRHLWSDIDFELRQSEILYIQGASGVGKSTLLKVVARLVRPDAGKVFYRGQDNSNLLVSQYRLHVRYFAQYLPKLTMNALQYIERMNQWDSLKKQTQSKDGVLAQRFQQAIGLDPQLLQQSFQKLSGGESQLVNIYLNLVYRPECLLLDEPTSALDPITREKVEAFLMQIVEEFKLGALWVGHTEGLIGKTHLKHCVLTANELKVTN